MVYNFVLIFSMLTISCLAIQVNDPKVERTTVPHAEEVSNGDESNNEDIFYFNRAEEERMLLQINNLRKKGCRCDGKYYAPVQKLKWNRLLYISAYKHAKSMHDNGYFSHYSPDGKDIGDRLDLIGYRWQYAGENLAEGQKSFDEAMHDWIASPTHCIMLMNPNMEEVGVARYGDYWVQHFGKRMPKNSRRINERYTDGSK